MAANGSHYVLVSDLPTFLRSNSTMKSREGSLLISRWQNNTSLAPSVFVLYITEICTIFQKFHFTSLSMWTKSENNILLVTLNTLSKFAKNRLLNVIYRNIPLQCFSYLHDFPFLAQLYPLYLYLPFCHHPVHRDHIPEHRKRA